MKLILLTIGLLALAFAGIAIKIWAKKVKIIAKTCLSSYSLILMTLYSLIH
jgi:hypothetical protein